MPKKLWICFVAAFLVVLAMPLIIDWFIIGNSFPSNISNSDWVGFMGGYTGAIIGCVGSLVGIAWTIRFTRVQNRADRELQIRPYFDLKYRDTPELVSPKLCLGDIRIDFPGDEIYNQIACGILFIKNIGLGPAVKLQASVDIHDNKGYNGIFTTDTLCVTTNSIQPNEEATIVVSIGHSNANATTGSFPDNFDFSIHLSFCNLLNDHFKQTIKFSTSFYRINPNHQSTCNETRLPCFKGDIHIESVGEAKKTAKSFLKKT